MDHLDVDSAQRLIRGQLSPEEAALWHAHLRDCERCRQLVADERALGGLLALGESPEPPDVEPDLQLERVQRLTAKGLGRPARRPWGTVVLVLLIVGLGGLLGWQIRQRYAEHEEPDPAPALTGLEQRAADRIDLLRTIDNDPWIVTDYEAVEMLDRLVRGESLEP